MKSSISRLKRTMTLILSAIIISSLLAGCDGSSGSSNTVGSSARTENWESAFDTSSNGSYDYGSDGLAPSYGGEASVVNPEMPVGDTVMEPEEIIKPTDNTYNENTEKLVYKADVQIETKSFDNTIEALKLKVEEFNGVIQSEKYNNNEPNSYGYYGREITQISGYKDFSIVVRIPTPKYNDFLGGLDSVGNIKSSSSTVDNITQEYYSNKAYLDSYNNQLKSLQSMYERANTISEMIEIESRISEVQAQINRLTTTIKSMDMDVAYSIVSINVSEVVKYTDPMGTTEESTFLDKIKARFIRSWETLLTVLENLVYLVIDLVWLILFICILAVIAIFLYRRHKQKLIKQGRIMPDGRVIYPSSININQESTKNMENIENKSDTQK